MLVVLRLALGWHFLYEGVWKLTHRDAFVAETEGFLTSARGPAAGLFNAMVPDIDGHKRLEQDLALIEIQSAPESGGTAIKVPKLAERWEDLTTTFVTFYRPAAGADADQALYVKFADAAKEVWKRHVRGLTGFVQENGGKIKAHFESLKRYQDQVKTDPSVDFIRQRRGEELQDLRKEAKGWIADLDAREKAMKADLRDLLNKERAKETTALAAADAKAKDAKPAEAKNAAVDFSPLAKDRDSAGPFRESRNPFKWSRVAQLAFLLSYALTAIGLCLMLGLFTRLSALAGAAFMLSIVLSQPSYPGVYPPDLPQMGHALLVNKDFVEMVALLVIASSSLGRWTGLDFFLHYCFVKPFCRCCCKCKNEGENA